MTDNFENKVAVDGPLVNEGELGSSTFSPGQVSPAGPLGLGQRWTVTRKREVALRLLLASFTSLHLESQITPLGNPLRFRQFRNCSRPRSLTQGLSQFPSVLAPRDRSITRTHLNLRRW